MLHLWDERSPDREVINQRTICHDWPIHRFDRTLQGGIDLKQQDVTNQLP